jgi:hypothetical protein
VKAIWAAGGYYSAAAGAVEREYSLELTFDEGNLLAGEVRAMVNYFR